MKLFDKLNPFSNSYHSFERLKQPDINSKTFWAVIITTFFLSLPTAFLGTAGIFRWLTHIAVENTLHRKNAKTKQLVNSSANARETYDYWKILETETPHLEVQQLNNPEELVDYLENNLKIAYSRRESNCDPIESLEEIYQVISSLPHAREQQDDGRMIWDELSSHEAQQCLHVLFNLNAAMIECAAQVTIQKEVNDRHETVLLDKSKMLEIALKSYDIAAQLAPKIPSLSISSNMGFSLNIQLISNKIFLNPKIIEVVEQIKDNFEARNKNKEDRLLFPTTFSKHGPHHNYLIKLYGNFKYNLLKTKLTIEDDFSKDNHEASIISQVLNDQLPMEYYYLETLALMPGVINQAMVNRLLAIAWGDRSLKNYYASADENDPFSQLDFPFVSYWLEYSNSEKYAPADDNNLLVNRKIAKQGSEGKMPAEVKQELLSLASAPSPELAIDWALRHLEHLDNVHVQTEWEEVLFSGDLAKTITENSSELKHIAEKFLDKAYKYYSSHLSDVNTLLWILKISDNLTKHFHENLNSLNTLEIQNQLFKINYETDVRLRIIEHQLDHFNYIPPKTAKDYETILKCSFLHAKLTKQSDLKPILISYRAQEALSRYYRRAQFEISQQELNSLAHSLLDDYKQSSDADTENWEIYKNELTNETYSFILNQGMAFKDKRHLVSSPHGIYQREAPEAIDQPKKLSSLEIDLFMRNYQVLLGNDPEYASIGNKIQLRQDGQLNLTENDLSEIKNVLVEASVTYPIFNELENNLLKDFLNSPLDAQPDWLKRMTEDSERQETADLITLQHKFIQASLAHVLAQQDVDYAKPTHSDADISMALTIQHAYQKGMSYEDCHALITHLKQKHLEECTYEIDKSETAANNRLNRWLSESGLSINLDNLNLNDEETMFLIHEHIHKHKDAIQHFLSKISLDGERQLEQVLELQELQIVRKININVSVEEIYDSDTQEFSIKNPDFPNRTELHWKPKANDYIPPHHFKDTEPDAASHYYLEDKLHVAKDKLPKLIVSYPFMLKTGHQKNSYNKLGSVTEKQEFIRPLKAILVQIDTTTNTNQYIALSAKGYAHYKNEILERKNPACKEYVIVTLDGELLVKSSEADVEELQKSNDLQQILSLAALLNGRIRNVNVVAKMVEPLGKDGFEELIKAIQSKAIGLNFKLDNSGIAKVKAINANIWAQAEDYTISHAHHV